MGPFFWHRVRYNGGQWGLYGCVCSLSEIQSAQNSKDGWNLWVIKLLFPQPEWVICSRLCVVKGAFLQVLWCPKKEENQNLSPLLLLSVNPLLICPGVSLSFPEATAQIFLAAVVLRHMVFLFQFFYQLLNGFSWFQHKANSWYRGLNAGTSIQCFFVPLYCGQHETPTKIPVEIP